MTSIQYLKPNADPLKIELNQVIYDQLDAPKEEILKLQMDVSDDNNNSSSN